MLRIAEMPEWLARVAVVAAAAGAKADAMRLWARAANLDLTSMHGLDQLLAAGLRNELAEFYQEVQNQLPASTIPPKRLAKLQQP